MTTAMRRLLAFTPFLVVLASCTPSRPAPQPAAPPPVAALPAAPPQQDWRDVPLTPGVWSWRGTPSSLARFGLLGQPAPFAVRCDSASGTIVFSRAGMADAATTMTFTSSFGVFTLPARTGEGDPPAIVASASARDPRLDQLAFSRGRYLVDVPGQDRLVIPAWPEAARVIEDCRS